MTSRRRALERALDYVIQNGPCSCPRKNPRIVVHSDECYIGAAINIASDYDDDEAEELHACEAHGVYGCPYCNIETDDE